MNASALTRMRRSEVGIMLQNPSSNLLPYATALGNLGFSVGPSHRRRDARVVRERALGLLEAVGLADRAHEPTGRFSGGEQQRLALAAALMNRPQVLLADEPTSQLDAASAEAVLALLTATSRETGTTVVAVTHDDATAAALGRTVTIRDGRVGAEGRAGEDYVVVGRDGTVTLPPELLDVLPPGSLARPIRHDDGVELRRVT
jgi:ABC-type lipoprotein export system ATPase subunit